jgi:hypothetical protein
MTSAPLLGTFFRTSLRHSARLRRSGCAWRAAKAQPVELAVEEGNKKEGWGVILRREPTEKGTR